MTTWITINDCAAELADNLGLDSTDVRRALSSVRRMVGRWDDLRDDADRRSVVEHAVWSACTGDDYWPFT